MYRIAGYCHIFRFNNRIQFTNESFAISFLFFIDDSDLPSDVMAHPTHCVKLSNDLSINGGSCEL